MSITVKTSDTASNTLIEIVKSIQATVDYIPAVSDFTKINSFTNYIVSRYIDKIQSIAINYFRLQWTVDNMKFDEIEKLVLDKSIISESSKELAASILRPLIEIYLDLKSIELSKEKFEVDYNTSCEIIYFDALSTLNNQKKSVSKDFYNCEPKYYLLFSDMFSKELNDLKKRLSNKDIPLLKNVKSKYKTIIENYGNSERLFLGFDYFTQYSILSKKIHFSYINQSINLSTQHYFHWSLLYFVLIYQQIMKLINKENKMTEELLSITDFLLNLNKETSQFENGDFIFFEFGVAEIVAQKDMTYDIRYYISNIFKTNETDQIPRFAMGTKVDKQVIETIKAKYYTEEQEIYNDKFFEDFYLELDNIVNPQGSC